MIHYEKQKQIKDTTFQPLKNNTMSKQIFTAPDGVKIDNIEVSEDKKSVIVIYTSDDVKADEVVYPLTVEDCNLGVATLTSVDSICDTLNGLVKLNISWNDLCQVPWSEDSLYTIVCDGEDVGVSKSDILSMDVLQFKTRELARRFISEFGVRIIHVSKYL